MRALISNVVGAWLGFATIALFVKKVAPKDTAITCGWCGHAVPMKVASKGGIGAVNSEMRVHMTQCKDHPMHALAGELEDARAAMKTIYNLACPSKEDPLQQRPHVQMERIREIAGRMH